MSVGTDGGPKRAGDPSDRRPKSSATLASSSPADTRLSRLSPEEFPGRRSGIFKGLAHHDMSPQHISVKSSIIERLKNKTKKTRKALRKSLNLWFWSVSLKDQSPSGIRKINKIQSSTPWPIANIFRNLIKSLSWLSELSGIKLIDKRKCAVLRTLPWNAPPVNFKKRNSHVYESHSGNTY